MQKLYIKFIWQAMKNEIVVPSNVKTFIALFESSYTNNVLVAILFSKLAFKGFD